MTANNEHHAVTRQALLKHLNEIATQVRPSQPGLFRILTGLAPHVPPNRLERFIGMADEVANARAHGKVSNFMDLLVEGNRVFLWGAALRFQARSALDTIAEEILVRREYHFRSQAEAPMVIDAGANFGLATYYARRMCKAGRVICFEPNPATFKVLSQNAAANKWGEVELHEAAIAAHDGEAELTFNVDAPLAASMTPRKVVDTDQTMTVPTLSLVPFLQQPVGLLKMDIEGAEADALEACENDLEQVENIFVEVHPVQDEHPGLLWRVLGVLDRAGYRVHVSRSPWSEDAHGTMPLMNAYRTYSLSVFATRLSA